MSLEKIDALLKQLSEVMSSTPSESAPQRGVQSSYKDHEIKVVPHERGLKNVLYIDGKEQESGFFSVGAAQKYGEKLIDDPEIERDRGQKTKTEDGDAGFDAWMAKVDAEVKKISGMAVADLDDAPYHDWYEDDLSPSRAARRAIQNAGG